MPASGVRTHPAAMIVVTEAEAAAIRAAFEQRGELSTAVELRRLFPGVTDTAQARASSPGVRSTVRSRRGVAFRWGCTRAAVGRLSAGRVSAA